MSVGSTEPHRNARRGGKLLADQLVVHGTDVAFCVPGESYIELLDGLYESPIRLITCRHEASAANMAEAYGKLKGRPAAAMVTRGPGACHGSIGVSILSPTPGLLKVCDAIEPKSVIVGRW